jgi:hypothetical protein
MPTIVYEIIDLIGSLIRLIGVTVLGLGMGWLSLDLLRKNPSWQLQAVVFLGLAGLVIAMVILFFGGATGAFALGVGLAIFMWGMLKKKKDGDKED